MSAGISNPSAQRGDDDLILEGIVSSQNVDGTTNISPMGPVVDRAISRLRLRPFSSSTTYQNLKRNRVGVFHVTDDVDLLARAAIGRLENIPELKPCSAIEGKYLATCCRWFAFEVTQLDDANERIEIECRVVETDTLRPFLGWNRAMHAVLEAAILATRVHMLPAEEIQCQLEPLAVIVEKTAGRAERDAFQLLSEYIAANQNGAS